MLTKYFDHLLVGTAAFAVLAAGLPSANAITINVDGSNYTTLSAAVAAAYASDDDGEDIINLNVDALPTADGQIVLSKPITINGDGNGNSVKCDLLVDITGIQAAADLNQAGKCYIEIQATTSPVVLNDLKIHPNADGADTLDDLTLVVDGVRTNRPLNVGEVGIYTLNRVCISGSDENNNYIPLDTGSDLYTSASKKWTFGGASQAVIQVAEGVGSGISNVTLNDCHAGLGKSSAVNIPAGGGSSTTINRGLYGHCGGDGIRASGTSVTLSGTPTDRLRIVRSTNISGGNRHALEVDAGGKVLLMEYVDIASLNTANLIKMQDSGGGQEIITEMRYVRAMGKLDEGVNQAIFTNGHSRIVNAHDVTFVGSGSDYRPMGTGANSTDNLSFTDCIFTSENLGAIQLDRTGAGLVNFTNCAIPVDNWPAESLQTTAPITGSGAAKITNTNPIVVSPQYLLTLEDYDWSENQGASNPLNGAGNANVLRPANPVYLTANSAGGPLVGGAGPVLSGIDPGTWMLMD